MTDPDGPDGPDGSDGPGGFRAAEALALLDAQVAAGALDLVEYWRLRAQIESASLPLGGVTPREAPAPRGGAIELLPSAPSLPARAGHEGLPTGPQDRVPATAPPVPPVPSRRPDPAGEPDPAGDEVRTPQPAAVPGEDAPFAPPSGAVNLRHHAQPQPPRRRWWRRNR